MKHVYTVDDLPGAYPVSLHQRANGLFRVTYGAEVHDGLTDAQAAKEFGLCLLHALQCAGMLLDTAR